MSDELKEYLTEADTISVLQTMFPPGKFTVTVSKARWAGLSEMESYTIHVYEGQCTPGTKLVHNSHSYECWDEALNKIREAIEATPWRKSYE